MSFQLLSILSKTQRVSRVCDPDTLIAEAGTWVELNSDGSVALVGVSAPKVSKLLYNGNSDSMYESHDVALGRITTLETIGARVQVSSDFLVGDMNQGDDLYVVYNTESDNGKLASAQEAADGTYTVVGKVEQVNADGSICYSTVSPVKVTIA